MPILLSVTRIPAIAEASTCRFATPSGLPKSAPNPRSEASAIETVIGLFKTEVIHRRGPWHNLDTVEYATLQWVDWYNNRRILEPIGNIPPVELEASYYQSMSQLPMAA